jgi:hypothetical protein
MVPLSHLSPKTEVRESKIHGRGLFATAAIAKDEIVAVKGGHIVDGKTLREKIKPVLGPVEVQIDDDLFIAPVTDEESECQCCVRITHAIRILECAGRSPS